MIEVQHLNLAFGEGEKRNQVLYDVSFHVKPGEIYGLVGESGCGKSTIVRLIDGNSVPLNGQIRVGITYLIEYRVGHREHLMFLIVVAYLNTGSQYDGSSILCYKSVDHLQYGGFSGSISAYQGDMLAALDIHIYS